MTTGIIIDPIGKQISEKNLLRKQQMTPVKDSQSENVRGVAAGTGNKKLKKTIRIKKQRWFSLRKRAPHGPTLSSALRLVLHKPPA